MCDRAISKNYYEVLGVSPVASLDEIRVAFRALARLHHPDTADQSLPNQKMAEINAAWSVLSDHAKRREYDRTLREAIAGPQNSRPTAEHSSREYRPVTVQPARFPWRGILFFGVLAMLTVLILHAMAQPMKPEVPDNLLTIGSCINIDREQFVREVSCLDSHDGIVRQLVVFDGSCPSGTQGYLDRQGLGIACIDETVATNR